MGAGTCPQGLIAFADAVPVAASPKGRESSVSARSMPGGKQTYLPKTSHAAIATAATHTSPEVAHYRVRLGRPSRTHNCESQTLPVRESTVYVDWNSSVARQECAPDRLVWPKLSLQGTESA